jgi:hypothetical protein
MHNNLVQLSQRKQHAIPGEARVIASFQQDLTTEVCMLVQPGHTTAMHLEGAQVIILHAFADQLLHVVASGLQIDSVSAVVAVLEHGDGA